MLRSPKFWGLEQVTPLHKCLHQDHGTFGGALCSIMIRQTYDVEGKQGREQKEAIGHMAQKVMASHGGAQA